MKKYFRVLVCFCLMAVLAGCGNKEQTVTYQLAREEDGLGMVDTMTLCAKGDVVQQITEVIDLDFTSYDEETKELLYVVYEEMVAAYASVEGVTCTGEAGEGTYQMCIDIDATGTAVAELAEQGLLQVEGESQGISLKLTGESLENNGYVEVKTEEK